MAAQLLVWLTGDKVGGKFDQPKEQNITEAPSKVNWNPK